MNYQNQVDVHSLIEKWEPVLNAPGVDKISDHRRMAVTAQLLENQENSIQEERQAGNHLLMESPQANVMGNSSSTVGTGNIDTWDPILISLVRRSTPNLVAHDIAGVQPMSGPVGLIFCYKSRYVDGSPKNLDRNSEEALFNEAKTGWSGDKAETAGDPSSLPTAENVYDSSPEGWSNSDDATLNGLNDAFGVGQGVDRSVSERFTTDAEDNAENKLEEMGFTIEKTSITAKGRALRASYTVELAQDLKAVHGLDAESELSNMLATEIMNEMNREMVRTVNRKARLGAQHLGLTNVANGGPGGVFDLATDADGRWSVEKYRGLLMQIEREGNVIAKQTRLGRGNFVIVSSDIASALNASGILQYDGGGRNNLQVDDTGNTFAGVLGGRIKVFIDPFATVDYMTMGYKGASPMAAGLFWCPYVPLTPYRGTNDMNYQPSIMFKSRYAIACNPFAHDVPQDGVGTDRDNKFYRIFAIKNILS